MSKRTASLMLGLLANAEAQSAEFNAMQEANYQAMLDYSNRQKNLSALDGQSMVDKVNENLLKRQKELMQKRQEQDIDKTEDPNTMDRNALDETWGAKDHKKYSKHKKRKDKRAKKRNLEQFELDKEDEDQRRKAYDAEISRKQEAKEKREDLKRKQIEAEEKERIEQEEKIIERNDKDRKDKEDEDKARQEAKRAKKEARRKVRDEEQRAEEERLTRYKQYGEDYTNSPVPHHEGHRGHNGSSDSEEQYFNELLGLSQANNLPNRRRKRKTDNRQNSFYPDERVNFVFEPKYKVYSSDESFQEFEAMATGNMPPKQNKPSKKAKKKRAPKDSRYKKADKQPENVPLETEPQTTPLSVESNLSSQKLLSPESSFLSGYNNSLFDSKINSMSSASDGSSSDSSSSSSSNKSNSASSDESSESTIRFSSVSTERTPSYLHSDYNPIQDPPKSVDRQATSSLPQPAIDKQPSLSQLTQNWEDIYSTNVWNSRQIDPNEMADGNQTQFVQWIQQEMQAISDREVKAKRAASHALQQAEAADARVENTQYRAALAQGRLAMLDRESIDAEKRHEELQKQALDAEAKLVDINRRKLEAHKRGTEHERQMIEAEAKWAKQEQDIIETEMRSHRQKRAAINSEKQAIEAETQSLSEEIMAARYEGLFQREEHASKQDLVLTIQKQKTELEKLSKSQQKKTHDEQQTSDKPQALTEKPNPPRVLTPPKQYHDIFTESEQKLWQDINFDQRVVKKALEEQKEKKHEEKHAKEQREASRESSRQKRTGDPFDEAEKKEKQVQETKKLQEQAKPKAAAMPARQMEQPLKTTEESSSGDKVSDPPQRIMSEAVDQGREKFKDKKKLSDWVKKPFEADMSGYEKVPHSSTQQAPEPQKTQQEPQKKRVVEPREPYSYHERQSQRQMQEQEEHAREYERKLDQAMLRERTPTQPDMQPAKTQEQRFAQPHGPVQKPQTAEYRYEEITQTKALPPRPRESQAYIPQISDRKITSTLDEQKHMKPVPPEPYIQPSDKQSLDSKQQTQADSKPTPGEKAKQLLPTHSELDEKLLAKKKFSDSHEPHHEHHDFVEEEVLPDPHLADLPVNIKLPSHHNTEELALQKTLGNLDRQGSKLLQEKQKHKEQASRMAQMAEAARRKYQSPAQTLATDNRFTAEAYQQFRAQERELEAWKRQEDAELQHDYQARLAEMRQEYHTKLVDIDKAYHEKERSLEVEQAKLERDLAQAREQLSQFDEMDEVIEFGMILPASISSRDQPRHGVQGHAMVPAQQPVLMSNDEYNLPMTADSPYSGTPVHTFNQMQRVYYNLASRQVPNTYEDHDPLSDIKRREKEILKEREYREHELRMEYEKRLEEFEADYRLKESELEKERLYIDRLLIAEREKEIEHERKELLHQAFGTDGMELQGPPKPYYDIEEVDDSYGPESYEDFGEPAKIQWDLEITPKRKQRRRNKDQGYTWPSERNYEPLKNYKPLFSDDSNSSEEENGHHSHHHKKRHHEKKHHKKQKKSKKEKKSHKKHHHHHNQIEIESASENESAQTPFATFDLDLKLPTMPSVPQKPAQPVYHEGITDLKVDAQDEQFRSAAQKFGYQMLDLKGKEGPQKQEPQIPKKIQDKVLKKQSEQKAPWVASLTHFDHVGKLPPVDQDWREKQLSLAELSEMSDEIFVEVDHIHPEEGSSSDFLSSESSYETFGSSSDESSEEMEFPIIPIAHHQKFIEKIPVVPVRHFGPKPQPKEKAEEQDQEADEAGKASPKPEDAKKEGKESKPVREKSRYRGAQEQEQSGDQQDQRKSQKSSKYKSHKKDKKQKHRYGDDSHQMPMRYHSGYGIHRPMHREPMYEGQRPHWYEPYAPPPFWDPRSAPFMVRDPAYTEHHMPAMYPMMYPMYPHPSHYPPIQSQHPQATPTHLDTPKSEKSTASPLKDEPKKGTKQTTSLKASAHPQHEPETEPEDEVLQKQQPQAAEKVELEKDKAENPQKAQKEEKPVVTQIKPLNPAPKKPDVETTDFESGFMSGYEKGIAAERERLLKEFEERHRQEQEASKPTEKVETEEPDSNDLTEKQPIDNSEPVNQSSHYVTEDGTVVSESFGQDIVHTANENMRRLRFQKKPDTEAASPQPNQLLNTLSDGQEQNKTPVVTRIRPLEQREKPQGKQDSIRFDDSRLGLSNLFATI